MTSSEFRATLSLAAVFSVRLLGLFMIYPVFEAYARHLAGATPALIGLALGIYGLTQGILQIPFGLISDRWGRKPMIVLGLILFAIGSTVSAMAHTMEGMVIGRALQGGGAVGSVVLALLADLTAEEHRTSAMAAVGISIGFVFMFALVTGPLLAGWIGVSGIFWIMVGLALLGIALTLFVVPQPARFRFHRDAEPVPAMFGRVLANAELLRLNLGVFVLHAMLTASFLSVPVLFKQVAGVTSHDQWYIYLPVLVISTVVMVPAIIIAEKYRRMKQVFVASVAALLASQLMLLTGAANIFVLRAAVTLFFAGFNVMEASLPSLITKTAPPDAKGTATGLYSSGQFIGIFVGGALGGWIYQAAGDTGLFAMTSAMALIWLIAAATMARPSYLTTRLVRVGAVRDPDSLAAKLKKLPGVAEAVIVVEDGLAYLKVDSKAFDAEAAEVLAGAS